jgi:hypothetical protein
VIRRHCLTHPPQPLPSREGQVIGVAASLPFDGGGQGGGGLELKNEWQHIAKILRGYGM